MNIKKIFAKMVKAYSKGESVTLLTDYDNAQIVLKYLLSMPDTYVAQIIATSQIYDGYDGAFFVNLDTDGAVWCEPAIVDGRVLRGGGLIYVDTDSIGDHIPDEFGIAGECKIKIVGGGDD